MVNDRRQCFQTLRVPPLEQGDLVIICACLLPEVPTGSIWAGVCVPRNEANTLPEELLVVLLPHLIPEPIYLCSGDYNFVS